MYVKENKFGFILTMKFDIKKATKWQGENSACLFCKKKGFYRIKILAKPQEPFRVTFVCRRHMNRFFLKMRYLLKWEKDFTATLQDAAQLTHSLLNYHNNKTHPKEGWFL